MGTDSAQLWYTSMPLALSTLQFAVFKLPQEDVVARMFSSVRDSQDGG